MRWWASLALVAAQCAALGASACHGPPPATAGSPAQSSAGCKVSQPVCDPRVNDDTALTLVRRRCAGCHAEGGKAEHPFLDADALAADRGNIALRLAGCEMPPDDAPPLPADERARLIRWGACVLPAAPAAR